MAVSLLTEVARHLRVDLPPAVLLHAPTVRGLARTIEDGAGFAWRTVVPLQAAGSRRPFFFVPPNSGYLGGFAVLARAWAGPARYGLQPQGLDGESAPTGAWRTWPRTIWRGSAPYRTAAHTSSPGAASGEAWPSRWRVSWRRPAKKSRCWPSSTGRRTAGAQCPRQPGARAGTGVQGRGGPAGERGPAIGRDLPHTQGGRRGADGTERLLGLPIVPGPVRRAPKRIRRWRKRVLRRPTRWLRRRSRWIRRPTRKLVKRARKLVKHRP